MANANGNDSSKVRSLRDLPPAIEPPRDLWAGIEARIAAEGAGSTDVSSDGTIRTAVGSRVVPGRHRIDRLRWLAAAAVIAALVVGIWIGRSGLPVSHPTGGGTGMVAHNTAIEGAQAVQAAYVSDPKFRSQREALVKSLETRLAALPPDSRAKVMASLATIHKSMQDLEAALGKDPTNALLQELLVNTYQDEMRVLTTVNEVGDAGKGI